METPARKYSTIGCCGIDCGLCPRFHTKGDSVCPGCGGEGFREKHPSCGVLTCCVVRHGFEVCAECSDYPCDRFGAEAAGYDSFVTHRAMSSNLAAIKAEGLARFLEQQRVRMDVLSELLTRFDDGRSKSFFCLGCTLLPLDELTELRAFSVSLDRSGPVKDRNRRLRAAMLGMASDSDVELVLNRKK